MAAEDAAAPSALPSSPSCSEAAAAVEKAARTLRTWALEGPPTNPRAASGNLAKELEACERISKEAALEVESLRARQTTCDQQVERLDVELAEARLQKAQGLRVLTKLTVSMAKRGAEVLLERRRTEAREAERQAQLDDERLRAAGLAEELAKLRQQHKALCDQVRESIPPVSVMCRVRPVESYASSAADRSAIAVDAQEITVEDGGARSRKFRVDRVLDGSVTQEDVFGVAAPWVESVLSGGSACLMAYGATGSGKTYTLHGIDAGRGQQQISGVAHHALRRLIDGPDGGVGGEGRVVRLSIMEVYCDQIRDLLAGSGGAQSEAGGTPPTLQCSRRDTQGKMVLDREELQVNSFEAAEELLQQGYAARATEATMCNERSSRSHIVLTIRVPSSEGQLVLVDLAGSENVHRSGADECCKLLAEAKSINKSLSSLADVVEALAKRQSFVPYRNSRLTMLLEEVLSQAKVLLLTHISPFAADAPITSHSLTFAGRVRSVDFGAQMLRKDQEQRLKSEHQRGLEQNRKLEAQADALRKELADSQKERNEQKAKLAQLSEQCRDQQRELSREKELRARLEAVGRGGAGVCGAAAAGGGNAEVRASQAARAPAFGAAAPTGGSASGRPRRVPTPPVPHRSPREGGPLGSGILNQVLGPGGRPVFGDVTNHAPPHAIGGDEIKEPGYPGKQALGQESQNDSAVYVDGAGAEDVENMRPDSINATCPDRGQLAEQTVSLPPRNLFGGDQADEQKAGDDNKGHGAASSVGAQASSPKGEQLLRSILKKAPTNFAQRQRRRREQQVAEIITNERGAGRSEGKTVAFAEQESEAASPPRWYFQFVTDLKVELDSLSRVYAARTAAEEQQEQQQQLQPQQATQQAALQPVLQQHAQALGSRQRLGSPRYPVHATECRQDETPAGERARSDRPRTPSPHFAMQSVRKRTPTPVAGREVTARRKEQEAERPVTRVAWQPAQDKWGGRWRS